MTLGNLLTRGPWLVAALIVLVLSRPAGAVCSQQHCLVQVVLPTWVLAKTTGRPLLDRKLYAEARTLGTEFGVSAELFVFNDVIAPNAFASPESLEHSLGGTVYIGKNLLDLALRTENMGESAIVLIMAHEWAHILQGRIGFPAHLPLHYREFHADLLAGWYLARRGLPALKDLSTFAVSTYGRGGDHFLDASSHGSIEARTSAMMFGYQHADVPVRRIYRDGLVHLLRSR